MQKNMFFNLNTMINRAKKKHNISIPDKLLSSIHVTINSKGIYFISYLTNENQKSSIDDWINLSLAREKILSKTLKLETLETNFEMKKKNTTISKNLKVILFLPLKTMRSEK